MFKLKVTCRLNSSRVVIMARHLKSCAYGASGVFRQTLSHCCFCGPAVMVYGGM